MMYILLSSITTLSVDSPLTPNRGILYLMRHTINTSYEYKKDKKNNALPVNRVHHECEGANHHMVYPGVCHASRKKLKARKVWTA